MHERALCQADEVRKNVIITRLALEFKRLGVNGGDVVEFHRDDVKVYDFGEGRYIPIPIEYKRGA